jgi:hypothetical protein
MHWVPKEYPQVAISAVTGNGRIQTVILPWSTAIAAPQQFRGGAPGLKDRRLPTGRKHDVSRPGRKPTQSNANHETVAARLPN